MRQREGGMGPRGLSRTMSTRPYSGRLGAITLSSPGEELQLGRVLLPGWDQMVRSRRGLGPAGWAAILRTLPAWGHLHKAYLLPPERPGEF